MRISIKEQPQLAGCYRVYIDGIEEKGCYEANEETGIALCYKRDGQGRWMTTGSGSNIKVVTEEKRGVIQFIQIVNEVRKGDKR